MNFLKFAMSAGAVLTAFSFTACDDSSSASDESGKVSYDCSVKDGVKVVSPKEGDSFKMGDTITVVYGSDIQGSGYRFVYKTSSEDMGLDMLTGSAGPEKPDGKTCYEQKVVLTDDVAEPSETAMIRVIPYENTAKGSNSDSFKVTK